MIRDTITAINNAIQDQLSTSNVQIEGIVVPYYSQQENAQALKVSDSESAISMNSDMVWQSMHLSDGSRPANTSQFGSFTDHIHDVRFILIGLTTLRTAFDYAMKALSDTSYVVIDSVEDDTLSVLTRYFRVKADQNKNYDPSLYAFAVRYHIEGVTDEELEDLTKVHGVVLLGDQLIDYGLVESRELRENLFELVARDEQSVTIANNGSATFEYTRNVRYPYVTITTL